ncbi:unnamed protein product [Peniophora sp. CBMAI 1063]|nr:unnamed protein product [Peniophora sp. CBMAI 1063]
MFTTLISAAALSLLAARGAMADFSVNSTAFTQCASTHITWSGTSNPVNILVVPAEDPCDDTLADLGDHSKTSMSWNVSLPAGTQLLISVEDSEGDEAWSDTITVQPSSDDSCLSAAQRAALPVVSSSASAAASTIAVSSSASAVVPESTAVAVVTATESSAASPSVTAGALGAANAGIGPSESSAAGLSRAPFALAGALVLAGAALL